MEPRGDPNLPDRLQSDLSTLYRANVRVAGDVDRAVTSRARAHFARRGRWIRWVGAGAAVAAVVVVGMMLIDRPGQPQVAHTVTVPTTVGDANSDGRVDIRDALSLARRIEAGSVDVTPREDVNDDRVIDRKDVDAIAMIAVRLDAEVVR